MHDNWKSGVCRAVGWGPSHSRHGHELHDEPNEALVTGDLIA